jgi:hypothetical protein
MKDFYDVYILLKNNQLQDKSLQIAIQETFKQRNTPFSENHVLFLNAFHQDSQRQIMWKAFLKKIKAENLDFEQVVKYITERLSNSYNQLISF